MAGSKTKRAGDSTSMDMLGIGALLFMISFGVFLVSSLWAVLPNAASAGDLAAAMLQAPVTAVSRHVDFLLTPHADWSTAKVFVINWAVQFVCSWIAFSIYIVWDYANYKAHQLEQHKLPSRHPLDPFWWSQLRMVPLVLYNQLVVWPLVMLLLVWPQWMLNMRPIEAFGGYWGAIPIMVGLMVISDQMWYWSHRFMHTPYAWRHWHKMHHIAEQTAISATYVHPVEYAMFTVAMNLPFALMGFPWYVHAFPMGWGMFTGSGAHSGYSGAFANGDKHNAHHLYHNVNFGLLMLADMMFGTHWQPGDPAPKVWTEAVKIWDEFKVVHGSEAASTFLEEAKKKGIAPAASRVGADADVDEAEEVTLAREKHLEGIPKADAAAAAGDDKKRV